MARIRTRTFIAHQDAGTGQSFLRQQLRTGAGVLQCAGCIEDIVLRNAEPGRVVIIQICEVVVQTVFTGNAVFTVVEIQPLTARIGHFTFFYGNESAKMKFQSTGPGRAR